MSERAAHLMERAGHEAARASWLFTAPNPRVGALALCEGHVVGRGMHAAFGGPHAEEAALREAGAWDDDAGGPLPGIVDEMVVTLEPCSAKGPTKKRQPCIELLRAAGIQRVLIGAVDPDPREQGRGMEALRAAGVECQVLEGSQANFERLNPAFLRALAHPARPFVLLKWAATFDGKTASDQGESQWISNAASRAEVHELRAVSHAVMAGKRTLHQDDPELSARGHGGPLPHQPLRVLLASDGEVTPDARVFQVPGPRLWLLREDAEPAAALRRHVETDNDRVLRLPADAGGKLDLHRALRHLRADFGVSRLLVEGGARLHGALLDAGLVDAVVRYESASLLGGSHGALLGIGFASPKAAVRLHAEERADLDGDLRRAFLVQKDG